MSEELTLVRRPVSAPSLTLRDLAVIFFRQRRVWILTSLTVFLCVMGYGLLTPSYQAHMKVLVRHGRIDPEISPVRSSSAEFQRHEVTEEELNSEVELLRDEEILRQVTIAAGLAREPGWLSRLWDRGEEVRIARAARRLGSRLEVEPVRKTALIAIRFASADPAEAAKVLRCLAQAYQERHLRVGRPTGESHFFEGQLQQARRDLDQAEFAMVNFSADGGVVSPGLERDMALQRLSEAAAAEQQTRIQIAETAQRVRALDAKLHAFPERVVRDIRTSDNPQLMEKLKSRRLELQLKRTELLTKFEPTYPLVQEVDLQIAEADAAIAEQQSAPLWDQTSVPEPNHEWALAELTKAEVEMSALTARSTASRRVLADSRSAALRLGQRALQQEDLLRNLKSAEERYLLYAGKREEARIEDALDQDGILNITVAEEPSVPALPARSALPFALLGLVLAGTVGTAVAFAVDYCDPAFRTPDEVVAYLETPVLACLPAQIGARP